MHAALLANVFSDIVDYFDELTDWLADFSANWWFLLIIFVVAFLDSVIPIVPSETMVIIGGVAAGQGEQSLWLVIVAGATGRLPRRQHRLPDRCPDERLHPAPGRTSARSGRRASTGRPHRSDSGVGCC